jgi:hypothetical protein
VRIRGEESGDRISFVEHAAVRGVETPWHVQSEDDEAYYVPEGELVLERRRGRATRYRRAPHATLAPRGVPQFRIDSDSARYVRVHTPAGHRRFYRERASDLTIPPTAEPDMPRLMQACEPHAPRSSPPPGAAEVAADRAGF